MISQCRGVLAIVVGLLLTVAVALGILLLVALPNLRQGSRILTPSGERAVKRAKQQAKQKPLAAADSTWHGLVALNRLLARLGRRIGKIWAPFSALLHEGLDRLEARDEAKGAEKISDVDSDTPHVDTPDVQAPDVHTPDVHTPDVQTPDLDTPDGDRAGTPVQHRVGRPRTRPAISGPIPEIIEDPSGPAQAGQAASDPEVEPGARTIDLRATERPQADQDAGGARRSR